MLVSAGGNVGSAASTRAVLTAAVAAGLVMPAVIPLYDGAARAPRISAVAFSNRHAIPGCQTIRISKPACFLGQSEGVTSQRPRGSPRDERLALLRVDRAGDGRGAGLVAQGAAGRPAATPSRQSAGRGPLRGRSGRWPPSRPDPAGGSSSCGTRWTAGRVTEARATPKQISWPIRAAAADGRRLGSSEIPSFYHMESIRQNPS